MLRHPAVVLLVAVVLPGVGHVLNRLPLRGLMFVFYMLLLGTVTYHLTGPDQSMVGRYAGGLFIYAISVFDAYTGAVQRTRAAAVSGGGAGR